MSLLDDILKHPDIVTPPNRQGEALAWCPWHNDKASGTPNLSINVTKKVCKCFSCGAPQRRPLQSLAEAWGIKPQNRRDPLGDVTASYDYKDENGELLYQAVRMEKSDGGKTFRQRRPDPNKQGWIWSLGKTRRVLYRLDRLATIVPGSEWVFVVEGEKDADRLFSLDLFSTTNAMGAGKWRSEYTSQLKGHKVAVLRDNDDAGYSHAITVLRSLAGTVADLRFIELDDIGQKGDVSDWLDAGHTKEQLISLLESTEPYQMQPSLASEWTSESDRETPWQGSKWLPIARKIIAAMREHGYFLHTPEKRFFFFDTDKLQVHETSSWEIMVLLNERYQVNRQDSLYRYLIDQLAVEAILRGRNAITRQFAHYDPKTNRMYLDLYDGHVLRITESDIKTVDNGADGVLFLATEHAEPWEYNPNAEAGLISTVIIKPMNLIQEDITSMTVKDQWLLLLVWMIALSFESIQPTKAIALAIGPAGSGKSSLFRRIGRLFFGPDFDVDALRRDKEDDFWTTVTNRPFACFDNVDNYIPWLADGLAQCATGVQVTKKKLYTDNTVVKFQSRCMLAITARTPPLRREDVASRLLIFRLERLPEKRSEYELNAEITEKRNDLLSDYARMVQKVLGATIPDGVDQGIRMADFANIAARIGNALGFKEDVLSVLNKLRRSQSTFATEEDSLFLLLSEWVLKGRPNEMGLYENNAGKRMQPTALFNELRALAETTGISWKIKDPARLSTTINNMREDLSLNFDVGMGRDGRSRWFSFAGKNVEDVKQTVSD